MVHTPVSMEHVIGIKMTPVNLQNTAIFV